MQLQRLYSRSLSSARRRPVPASLASIAVGGHGSIILFGMKSFSTICTIKNRCRGITAAVASTAPVFSSFSSKEEMTKKLFSSPSTSSPSSSSSSPSNSTTTADTIDTTTGASSSNTTITLYQYAICPFCNKAKAVLDYAGISYTTIEVNPLTKFELKELPEYPHYKKVPIATIGTTDTDTDGKQQSLQQINGSDAIIETVLLLEDDRFRDIRSSLQNRWKKDNSNNNSTNTRMTMDQFHSTESAKQWSKFASEEVSSLMYPNLCNTLGNSYRAFGYVDSSTSTNNFTTLQKVMIKCIGSVAMYFAASKIKAKHKITNEKEALRTAIQHWETMGLQHGRTNFGSGSAVSPDLGDLAMYGTLKSVEGLPAFDLAIQDNPIVKDWYYRMQHEVTNKTIVNEE